MRSSSAFKTNAVEAISTYVRHTHAQRCRWCAQGRSVTRAANKKRRPTAKQLKTLFGESEQQEDTHDARLRLRARPACC